MSAGWRIKRSLLLGASVLGLLTLIPCCVSATDSQAAHTSHRKEKKTPPPPLPSGPTGPVQQIPLDSMAPVPPQVTYENEQLTIVAANSTLADILRAVRKQTGAEIEIPAAPDRVVTRLGPGPAREVLAELLNGSRFNYVLLGSVASDAALTRVVLVAKSAEGGSPNNLAAEQSPAQAGNVAQQQQMAADTNDGMETEETPADDPAADQAAADAEQQNAAPPDQPSVKTPQQLLQEMQQRQMQFQQQQSGGQPPVPGMPQQPQQ